MKKLLFFTLLFFFSKISFSLDKAGTFATLLWTYDSQGSISSSLSVVNKRLYFGNSSGKFFALDATTGESIWTFSGKSTANSFISSPFFAGGYIYIGAFQEKRLYCIEESGGKKVWDFSCNGEIKSSPRVYGNLLYFGSFDGKIYCLDPVTGSKVWEFATSAPIHSSPLIISGLLFIGGYDRSFYCLDASTGEKIWEYKCPSEIESSAAFYEGRVYFGDLLGNFYSLDIDSGEAIWKFKADKGISSSPFIYEGRVYFGSHDSRIYCLDAKTGKKIWDYTTGGKILSSPCVVDNVVYFGSSDKKFYAIDATTKEKLYDLQSTGEIISSPCIWEGRIYFGTVDGKVYCLDTENRGIEGGNTLGAQEFFRTDPFKTQKPSKEVTTSEPGTNKEYIEYELEEPTSTNIPSLKTKSSSSAKEEIIPAERFNYTIQVASFRERENALKYYNRLKDKGYDVYQTEIKLYRKKYYRIRVGLFKTLDEAAQTRLKLINEGYKPVIIKFIYNGE